MVNGMVYTAAQLRKKSVVLLNMDVMGLYLLVSLYTPVTSVECLEVDQPLKKKLIYQTQYKMYLTLVIEMYLN